jgi:hypothetical protein
MNNSVPQHVFFIILSSIENGFEKSLGRLLAHVVTTTTENLTTDLDDRLKLHVARALIDQIDLER